MASVALSLGLVSIGNFKKGTTMAADIVLSAGVRANLLQLQKTSEIITSTQSKLATGKRVNSALDNPINYFTAHSFLVTLSAPLFAQSPLSTLRTFSIWIGSATRCRMIED